MDQYTKELKTRIHDDSKIKGNMGVQKGHIIGSVGVLVASAGIVCMLTIGYTAGGILVGLGVFIFVVGVVIQRKSGGWGEPKSATTLAVYTMMGPVDPIKTSDADTSPTKPLQPTSQPAPQKPKSFDESEQGDESDEPRLPTGTEKPEEPRTQGKLDNSEKTKERDESEPGAATESENPKLPSPQAESKGEEDQTVASDCQADDCYLLDDHSNSKERVQVIREKNSDNLASVLGLEKKSNDVMIDGLDCCDGSFDPTTTAPLLTPKPASIV